MRNEKIFNGKGDINSGRARPTSIILNHRLWLVNS
jgi:hypothetical protein